MEQRSLSGFTGLKPTHSHTIYGAIYPASDMLIGIALTILKRLVLYHEGT